jgi:uncharacterized protein YbbK (DUF523 family)
MEKIFISSCLLGEKVRYHGGDASVISNIIEKWKKEGRIVSLCPEVSAGFSVPRPPSEIYGEGGGIAVLNGKAKVVKKDHIDYSDLFVLGAQNTMKMILEHKIKMAILKEGSPSCGVNFIYDGSFSGKKVMGQGVTSSLLKKNGIQVFADSQLEEAERFLTSIESIK